jgi:hypothetical protein
VSRQVPDSDNPFVFDAQEHNQEKAGENPHSVSRCPLTPFLFGKGFRLNVCY